MATSINLVKLGVLTTDLSTALGVVDGEEVKTIGHATAGDGDSGTFRWDASDSTSTEDGGCVMGSSTNGRWKRVFGGAVNVRWFGATGDGTTDDSAAFMAALAFCFRSSSGDQNENLYIPKGTYLIESNECWSRYDEAAAWASYGTVAYRSEFSIFGDARQSSRIIFRPGGSTDSYLYDASNDAETDGENVWANVSFHRLGFKMDATGKTGGRINMFRGRNRSGFPCQAFRYHDCEVEGPGEANVAYAGAWYIAAGSGNCAENLWMGCRAYLGVQSLLRSDNAFSTNNHVISTHLETMSGPCYYFTAGSGVLHVGGSIIYNPTYHGTSGVTYILEINSTAVGGDFVFDNVKIEFNDQYGGIVKRAGTETANVYFRDSDFQASAGGARDAIVIDDPSNTGRTTFSRCNLLSATGATDFQIKINDGSIGTYWEGSYGRGHRLTFEHCMVPREFPDLITWESVAAQCVVRVRDCYFPTAGEVATDLEQEAHDADIFNPLSVGIHAKNLPGAELKTVQPYIERWPTAATNEDGLNTRIKLPPNSFLRSMYVRKTTKSGSGASYKLALINDDGRYLYGVSNTAAFSSAHTIDVVDAMRYLEDNTNRYIRLVGTREITYSGLTGAFTVGETVTGGTSAATGVIVADSGTVLTVVLGNHTDFNSSETITTAGGSATSSAFNDREADIPKPTEPGDLWVVEYY